jgi:hypothetical protein
LFQRKHAERRLKYRRCPVLLQAQLASRGYLEGIQKMLIACWVPLDCWFEIISDRITFKRVIWQICDTQIGVYEDFVAKDTRLTVFQISSKLSMRIRI